MSHRRTFIRTMAGAAAGMFAVGRGVLDVNAQGRGGGRGQGPRLVVEPPTGPVQRRIVQVGGRRVRVVDVHAHVTVPEVEQLLVGTEFAGEGGGRPMGPERIWEMDRRGIDVQAISVNGYWWYTIKDRALADKIVRAHDTGIAAWCKAQSDRFVGLTSPSMQFPDLAAAQLDYAVKTLGFRGASLGGHVNGESLADPKYDPFWAKANELQVPVFEHPGGAENVLKADAWEGTRGALGNIIGNPLETTVFFSHLIHGGTLDKFPNLRVIGAHGGGYLPSYSDLPTSPAMSAPAPIASTRNDQKNISRTSCSLIPWFSRPKTYDIWWRSPARPRWCMERTSRSTTGPTRSTTS